MGNEKMREEILSTIQGLDNLPTLDTNVLELNSIINSSDKNNIDINKVVRIIQRDIGLSGNILRIANTAAYSGRYGRIGDIQQAIMRLGIQQISKICLAVSGIKLFPETSDLISLTDFWKHSISVAMVIQKIGALSTNSTYDESNAYMAGLFHDIGILILDKYFSKTYADIRKQAEENPGPICKIEQKFLGIDHGEIGAQILKRWNFPEDIIDSVSNHHHPTESPQEFRIMTQMIHIADFACSALGTLEPGDYLPQECNESAWFDLGIEVDNMQQIIQETEEEIIKSGAFIEVQT